jgi:DNA-binding NarL/FixJ family response regulator
VTAAAKTRLLLADDHALVRDGLRLILEREPDFEVVAEAGDGAEALEAALRTPVDLAILDVSMPRLTGLQVAHRLRSHRPDLRIVMLSVHDNEQFFFESLKVGATGYVLKTAADEDLVHACRAALRDEPFIYAGAVRSLIRHVVERSDSGLEASDDVLTARERELVKLVAEGHTGKEIADLMSISEHTVERHRANVLEKLGLRDRVALTRYALRSGLVEP